MIEEAHVPSVRSVGGCAADSIVAQNLGRGAAAGPTYANSAWFLHVQEPSMANRIEFIKARSIITSTASNARHVSVFSSLEKNKPVACDLPGGMHLQATSYSVRRQVAPAGRANIDPLDHLIDHVRHQEGAGVIPSLGLHLSDVIDDQFNRQFNSCTGTTPVQHHALAYYGVYIIYTIIQEGPRTRTSGIICSTGSICVHQGFKAKKRMCVFRKGRVCF